mmetsp:Transcript_14770/g.40591  ORF Transcript_14770/g.40591 Transcript_14770/m.40591 type:complete len:232 (-) Transcript_14770:521-1216(-)
MPHQTEAVGIPEGTVSDFMSLILGCTVEESTAVEVFPAAIVHQSLEHGTASNLVHVYEDNLLRRLVSIFSCFMITNTMMMMRTTTWTLPWALRWALRDIVSSPSSLRVRVQDTKAHGEAMTDCGVTPTIRNKYHVASVLRASENVVLAIVAFIPELLCGHSTERRVLWWNQEPILNSNVQRIERCRVTVQGCAASVSAIKELLRSQEPTIDVEHLGEVLEILRLLKTKRFG